MKKRLFSKVSSAIITVMTVSAMAVPTAKVFSADTPTVNSMPAVVQSPSQTANIVVKKDIVLFNVDESAVLSPNVTYSYEVTSADVTNATITAYSPDDLDSDSKTPKTDAVPISVTVKSGPIQAISINGSQASSEKATGTVSFGESTDTVNNNTRKHDTNDEYGTDTAKTVDLSKKVTSSMTIEVDANKIYDPDSLGSQVNSPGVYRYKIEDVTEPDTLKACGITRGYKDTVSDHDRYIYLDVYTKYNSAKTGLEIYGYVLLRDTVNGDNESLNYNNTVIDETVKITGFDTDSENNEKFGNNTVLAGNLTSDSYHTYNVEVSKKTNGDLADTQHNFPFRIELTNTNTVTSLDDFYYVITKDGVAQSEVTANLDGTGSWSLDGETVGSDFQFQNGDKILITGLPVNTKIKVTETNDTNDVYRVSAKYANTDNSLATTDLTLLSDSDTTGGLSVSAVGNAKVSMKDTADISKTDSKTAIEFTNTLKDISVTGLLFSKAPFVLIAIAGGILIFISAKNRKRSDDKILQ